VFAVSEDAEYGIHQLSIRPSRITYGHVALIWPGTSLVAPFAMARGTSTCICVYIIYRESGAMYTIMNKTGCSLAAHYVLSMYRYGSGHYNIYS